MDDFECRDNEKILKKQFIINLLVAWCVHKQTATNLIEPKMWPLPWMEWQEILHEVGHLHLVLAIRWPGSASGTERSHAIHGSASGTEQYPYLRHTIEFFPATVKIFLATVKYFLATENFLATVTLACNIYQLKKTEDHSLLS